MSVVANVVRVALIAMLTLTPVAAQNADHAYANGFYEVRDIHPDDPPRAAELCQTDAGFCVVEPPLMRLDGAVESAVATMSQTTGAPIVSVTLTARGREEFAAITESHLREMIAIVANGAIVTAPIIYEPISGGALEIQGDFDLREPQEMAARLLPHKPPQRI